MEVNGGESVWQVDSKTVDFLSSFDYGNQPPVDTQVPCLPPFCQIVPPVSCQPMVSENKCEIPLAAESQILLQDTPKVSKPKQGTKRKQKIEGEIEEKKKKPKKLLARKK